MNQSVVIIIAFLLPCGGHVGCGGQVTIGGGEVVGQSIQGEQVGVGGMLGQVNGVFVGQD